MFLVIRFRIGAVSKSQIEKNICFLLEQIFSSTIIFFVGLLSNQFGSPVEKQEKYFAQIREYFLLITLGATIFLSQKFIDLSGELTEKKGAKNDSK